MVSNVSHIWNHKQQPPADGKDNIIHLGYSVFCPVGHKHSQNPILS